MRKTYHSCAKNESEKEKEQKKLNEEIEAKERDRGEGQGGEVGEEVEDFIGDDEETHSIFSNRIKKIILFQHVLFILLTF